METGDSRLTDERRWRIRLSGSFVGLIVWGILWVSVMMFTDGMSGTLAGILLLVVIAAGLGYYFGAGVYRISGLPSPEPIFARRFGRALAWLFVFLLVMVLPGAMLLRSELYGILPSPRREIATVGNLGFLCLIVVVALVLLRWRSALMKIGEGPADKRR